MLELKQVLRRLRHGPCFFVGFSSSLLIFPLFLLSFPGSKAAPRPGGIGSAAAGQPGMEGEGMFSKILPGGAAEQAGKLGEGMSKCNILGGKKTKKKSFSAANKSFFSSSYLWVWQEVHLFLLRC